MANATKSEPAKSAAPAKPTGSRTAPKLVPLEKRLGRLRKEEAKRKHQLEVVQARSERTKGKMSELIRSVNDWVQNPEKGAGDGQGK